MIESKQISRVFQRDLGPILLSQLKNFKVLLLTGPRQSGKTTLLKELFPEYEYHSLDSLDVRELARKDPRSLIGSPIGSPKSKIIDEIQEVPELLSFIKEHVDKSDKKGQFILTGSHQFHLMKNVSESLAGRVAIFNLLPFSNEELKKSGLFNDNLAQVILRGFYPQIIGNFDPLLGKKDETFPNVWFDSYINTYLERDLRTQLAIKDLRSFEVFLKLIATRIGQELNYHSLSNEVGVSLPTIKSWVSILEAAFIIYLLPPYYKNFGKRVIKTPKLYFYDTGLACHLTRINHEQIVLNNPLSGALFENLAVIELVKWYLFHGKKAPLYFWRSHDGLEVDILLEVGTSLIPMEVKLSRTITDSQVQNLEKWKTVSKLKDNLAFVISQSEAPTLSSKYIPIHWKDVGEIDGKIHRLSEILKHLPT